MECDVSDFYLGSRILEETSVSFISLHSKICPGVSIPLVYLGEVSSKQLLSLLILSTALEGTTSVVFSGGT